MTYLAGEDVRNISCYRFRNGEVPPSSPAPYYLPRPRPAAPLSYTL